MRLLAVFALMVTQAVAAALGRFTQIQWRQTIRYEPGPWCEVVAPDDHLVIYMNREGQLETLRSQLEIQRIGFFVLVEERWHEGPSGVTFIFRAGRELSGDLKEQTRAALTAYNLGLA